MSPRDLFFAIPPPVLWATGSSFGKGAFQHFQPLFTTAMMYAVACVILFRPQQQIRTTLPWLITISVFASGLQSSLIFHEVLLVDTSLANLVVQSQMSCIILTAWVLGLERLNPMRIGGVVLAILGIAVVVEMPKSGGAHMGLLCILAWTAFWWLGQAPPRISIPIC